MINRHFIKNLIWIAKFDDESIECIEKKLSSFDELDGYETENINSMYFSNDKEVFDFIEKNPFQKTDIIFIDSKKGKNFYNSLEGKIGEYSIIPRIFIIDKNVIHNTFEYYDSLNIPFFHKDFIYFSIKNLCNTLCKKETYKSETIPTMESKEGIIFSFEYIHKNKLRLPLFYHKLLIKPNDEEIEKFNKFCRNKDFAKIKINSNDIIDPRKKEEKEDLKYLLEQIERIEKLKIKIPFQILIKFWFRIYTYETNFYKEMNNNLRHNIPSNYDIYVRGSYHGLKYIRPISNKTLYRGSVISNNEIKELEKCLKNKKNNNSKICHCFCKPFFSCSLDKETAKEFMANTKCDVKKNSYALFIIEKGTNDDIDNISNVDLRKISFHPGEDEILFFPFSSFEITNIIKKFNEELVITNKRGNDIETLNVLLDYYEITLNYIGKYKKEVPIWDHLNRIEESNFAKCLLKTNILKKKELDPKIFSFDINKYINSITCKYKIPKEMINKGIKLINYKNKDNSCQISLNNEKINKFQSEYTFKKEGEYKFEFEFNTALENTSSLFENCKYLISVDLSKLNTEKLKLMINMFKKCENLKEFIFNNDNTQSIENLNGMFYECKSLLSVDLSHLNLQNVVDISSMFRFCTSIKNIKFFKSENVKSMDYLFDNCSSLENLDLSEFDCKNASEIGHVFGGSFNKECKINYEENSKFKLIDPRFSSIY